MSNGPEPSGSFFPKLSKAFISGGSYTINNHSTHVHTGEKSGYDRLVAAVSSNALHDSGHIVDPPKCHPGTRVAIIQTIVDWVAGTDERNRDKSITWLSGGAGAGKTAIGRTVCERCARDGTLLASFFFGANDPTRNHSKSLVPTISYQISALSPHIRKRVSDFIDVDPLILTRSLRSQFASLVMHPLLAGYTSTSQVAPRLIVVDGLDECVDLASQRDILDNLRYVVTNSPIPIRILVLSRPETNIFNAFNGTKINSMLFKIFLGDEYRPNDDIRRYLFDKFTELRKAHKFKASIPPNWPTMNQITELVEKASGQFIYASTVFEYVKSPRYRPHQRLDAVLGLHPPFKDLPFSELDALYTHLLNSTDDPLLSGDILVFLVLYHTMIPLHIDKYLNLEDGTSEVVLSDLTALVRMGTFENPSADAPFLLHKSIGDFLFDAYRSKTLAKDREKMNAGHLVRIMEWFSEGYNGMARFSPDRFTSFLAPLFDTPKSLSGLSASTYAAYINAVKNFPMEFYCKSLFQYPDWGYTENVFINVLFNVMSALEGNRHLPAGVYHKNAVIFWNLAFFELRNRYSKDWRFNYVYTVHQLRLQTYYHPFVGLEGTFHVVENYWKYLALFSDEQKSLVIAKAAVHCLTFLCDSSLAKKEANRHLQLQWIDGRKIRTHTWKRHRRTPSWIAARNLSDFHRSKYSTCSRFLDFLAYSDLFAWTVPSISPLYSTKEWTKWKLMVDITKQEFWNRYMEMLERLPVILPLAARFPILVNLCRKCFAPMSMMFPLLSRRARQAIGIYLDRVGVRLDDVSAAVNA